MLCFVMAVNTTCSDARARTFLINGSYEKIHVTGLQMPDVPAHRGYTIFNLPGLQPEAEQE
jgi:hypothetical protein